MALPKEQLGSGSLSAASGLAFDAPPIRRWPALIGGGLFNLALGTYYAWSVFVPALEREFGWVRTQTSWVASIDMLLLASMFTVAGSIQQRVGTRTIAVIGGMLFSLGWLLASWTTSLPMLYLSWGLTLGTGLGFGYLAPITVGSKWFPDKRGLVIGFAVAMFAAGSGIFGPVGGLLIERIGWRATFRVLAAVFFVLTMVGAYLLRDPPPGFRPPARRASDRGPASASGVEIRTGAMLRTLTFYWLWIAYCLGSISGTMVISQLVPFARAAGWSAATAAFAITVGAVGSASGRFFSGWMSDHFGRLFTIRAILLTSVAATPLLYLWRQELLPFYLLLFVVYYCYGTQISVYTAVSADFYGTRYLGVNYGLLLMAWGCAGVLGPLIGARVFVATGEYRYAFFLSAVLAFVALGSLLLARSPVRARAADAVHA